MRGEETIGLEVNLPRSLHWRLRMQADEEGVSFNALCNHFLASYLGKREAEAENIRYLRSRGYLDSLLSGACRMFRPATSQQGEQ